MSADFLLMRASRTRSSTGTIASAELARARTEVAAAAHFIFLSAGWRERSGRCLGGKKK